MESTQGNGSQMSPQNAMGINQAGEKGISCSLRDFRYGREKAEWREHGISYDWDINYFHVPIFSGETFGGFHTNTNKGDNMTKKRRLGPCIYNHSVACCSPIRSPSTTDRNPL